VTVETRDGPWRPVLVELRELLGQIDDPVRGGTSRALSSP
jgi:hypothetical protein